MRHMRQKPKIRFNWLRVDLAEELVAAELTFRSFSSVYVYIYMKKDLVYKSV